MRLRHALLLMVAFLVVGCDKANDLTGTHGVQIASPTPLVSTPIRPPATPTPVPGGGGAPCHPMPRCLQDD
jgi:hypothetical protein